MDPIIFNGDEDRHVQDAIGRGIEKLSKAVRVTLGPSGRVVLLDRGGMRPIVTKDGVTVAKYVYSNNRFEEIALQFMRQATSKTAAEAGDGTTTATILAHAMFKSGLKYIQSGVSPINVRRGMEAASSQIIDWYGSNAKPAATNIERIRQIATCSANHDAEMGNYIAEAIEEVGVNGVVTIEEGRSIETYVDIVEGIQFDEGYMSPHFSTVTNNDMCEYEEARVLLIDDNINMIRPLLETLQHCAEKGSPLLIITGNASEEVISTLLLNRNKNNLQTVVVKAPGFGDRRHEVLEDIASAVGAKVASSCSDVSVSNLGSCKRVKIDRDTTTIFCDDGVQDEIAERVKQLQEAIEIAANDFDKEKLQERIARLSGAVAQIVVGGATEAEVRERRDRMEDALHAANAAIEEGILPGGGVCGIYASGDVDVSHDLSIGAQIVIEALEEPLRQIAENAGIDPGVVIDKVNNSEDITFGLNAITHEYCDLIKSGVIVPAKVERIALQNAVSVATLLLSTACMIITPDDKDIEQETPQMPMGMMGGMGGMG